jgi:hypothetical protein
MTYIRKLEMFRRESRREGFKSTCQKIVKKRINFHPYKVSSVQELKPADYPRRVAYCN